MGNTQKKSYRSRKKTKTITHIILHIVLILCSIVFVFPFLWMLFTALKTPAELLQGIEAFFPKDPQWSNFVTAIQKIPFFLYLKNSLIISFCVVLGTIISATTAAYAFAKLKWKGRDKWFLIMLATMMLP
ncbi:MAG: hypothetical protein PHC62_11540, partial [Candidatus Izemoplasmatales bacterium]|nr:hypothetical protein [Candidatus Izemoplasmatales bacterium]